MANYVYIIVYNMTSYILIRRRRDALTFYKYSIVKETVWKVNKSKIH